LYLAKSLFKGHKRKVLRLYRNRKKLGHIPLLLKELVPETLLLLKVEIRKRRKHRKGAREPNGILKKMKYLEIVESTSIDEEQVPTRALVKKIKEI